MASSTILCFTLFFACSLFVRETMGGEEVICEKLPPLLCSFAVSSMAKRCVLENHNIEGKDTYLCKTSAMRSAKLSGYIETDECVTTCAVERHSVGLMESDPFISPKFTTRLCSPECYNNCPNIVELYSCIAGSRGLSLPTVCKKVEGNSKVAMPPAANVGKAVGETITEAARRGALGLLHRASAPSKFFQERN